MGRVTVSPSDQNSIINEPMVSEPQVIIQEKTVIEYVPTIEYKEVVIETQQDMSELEQRIEALEMDEDYSEHFHQIDEDLTQLEQYIDVKFEEINDQLENIKPVQVICCDKQDFITVLEDIKARHSALEKRLNIPKQEINLKPVYIAIAILAVLTLINLLGG